MYKEKNHFEGSEGKGCVEKVSGLDCCQDVFLIEKLFSVQEFQLDFEERRGESEIVTSIWREITKNFEEEINRNTFDEMHYAYII
jgi:hypothetical protein